MICRMVLLIGILSIRCPLKLIRWLRILLNLKSIGASFYNTAEQDPMVWKGVDIHCLLSRRLQHWRNQNFDDLVTEVECCAKQSPQS